MEPTRHFLRLVDDPVGSILWMLQRLPLERTAAYLALISQQAGRLGLVSEEDRARIDALLDQLPISWLDDRAA